MKELLVAVLIVLSLSVNGQFKVGAGIGINNASFSGIDATGSRPLSGLNVGIISEFKFPTILGIEMDFLFSMKGASALYYSNGKRLTRADRCNYIDIPLVIKLYMKKIISFQSGIQYSKLLSANIANLDVKDYLKSDNLAAVFGVGVDLDRIHTSFRYNLGLNNISRLSSDLKSNMVTVTLGFWIKK